MREYWRIADHGARRNSQVRPLPNICGSFGGFECMVLEIVGLSSPHAQYDRCGYVVCLDFILNVWVEYNYFRYFSFAYPWTLTVRFVWEAVQGLTRRGTWSESSS